MEYSENVRQLRPSATIAVSSLAKRLKAEGRDVIDLSAGEPDFDTPGHIAEAGIGGIRDGQTRYTPAPGMPALRQAIAAELSERAGREMDWRGVVVTAGAKQALFNACFTLFGPGDEVLVASPYWTSYPEIVRLARAEPVPVSGPEERDFRLTPDDLEAAATDRTRGLIYSSPSNPTGMVYSRDELRKIAEWARDRGVWLIADEIYRRIHFGDGSEGGDDPGPAPGLLELPSDSLGRYVLVDGASKSFAMTGWRLGFSWCDPGVATKLSALQSHVSSNAATPSQVAALAAYTETDATRAAVASMSSAFRRRRDLVVRQLTERLPDFPFVDPRGAFYVFFRVDAAFGEGREDATDFCSWLLEETGVALVPGAAFGDDRWVRMSYATSDDLIEEAFDRMVRVLAS